MTSYNKTRVIMGLALLVVFNLCGFGQLPMPKGSLDTLYPPLNLQCQQVECTLYIHWDKPQLPGGGTPAGLIGYNLYRDGALLHFNPHPDSTIYYECYIEPQTPYTYTVKAKYSIAPGVFGESVPAGPVTCMINCIHPLPYLEDWNSGSFTWGVWFFIPQQANWAINTSVGNPAPSSVFTGTPGLENYGITLKSYALPGTSSDCASFLLDFDYMLSDISAGSTEELVVLLCVDGIYYPYLVLPNQGSTGWIHQQVEMQLPGASHFNVAFKVQGISSSNIAGWYIDNILVKMQCKEPVNCNLEPMPHGARLTWLPPDCDSLQYVLGYKIYRSDSLGRPPFVKLHSAWLTGFEYIDTYPTSYTSWYFKYLITVTHKNPADGSFLCETPCDTLEYNHLTGTGEYSQEQVSITLQPNGKLLEIKTPWPLSEIALYSVSGVGLLRENLAGVNRLTLDVSGIPPGIYLIRLKHGSDEEVRKVVIVH